MTLLAPEASIVASVPEPLRLTLLAPVAVNFTVVEVRLPETLLAPERLKVVAPSSQFLQANIWF